MTMSGRDEALAALKVLGKTRLLHTDPDKLSKNLSTESDRAAVIILTSIVEDVLTDRLLAVMDGLNADEKARLFNFAGVLGTFSSRIRVAQALGVIDRERARRIDVIRELRNAAAHAQDVVDFDTAAFRDAAIHIFGSTGRETLLTYDRAEFRAYFTIMMLGIAESVYNPSFTQEDFAARITSHLVEPLRGKSLEA